MRKNDIIEAAFKEFSIKGYDNASINNIIKLSKTSKGTFYYYFKSKEDLYLYLADIVLKEKINFFEQIENNEIKKNPENIFELLKIQIDKSIEFSLAYPNYTIFSIQTRKETNIEIRDKLSKKMGIVSSNYYYNIINKNIENGIIRNDFPIDFIVSILTYMITHFIEFIQNLNCEISNDNKDFIKEQFTYYIKFIENGLSN